MSLADDIAERAAEIRAEMTDERDVLGPMAKYLRGIDGEPIDSATYMALVEAKEAGRLGWNDDVGDVEVSTVWLGLDLGAALDKRPPQIWETALFPTDAHVSIVQRYPSMKRAREGHELIVTALKKATDDP